MTRRTRRIRRGDKGLSYAREPANNCANRPNLPLVHVSTTSMIHDLYCPARMNTRRSFSNLLVYIDYGLLPFSADAFTFHPSFGRFCVLVLVLVATEKRVHGNEEGSLRAISLVELVWGTLKCHTRSEIFNVGGMGRQDPATLVVSGWRGEDKGVDV